jgi:hypothetical protein
VGWCVSIPGARGGRLAGAAVSISMQGGRPAQWRWGISGRMPIWPVAVAQSPSTARTCQPDAQVIDVAAGADGEGAPGIVGQHGDNSARERSPSVIRAGLSGSPSTLPPSVTLGVNAATIGL